MYKANNVSVIDECTGCGLCSFVCPKNAISMKEDENRNHFLYPKIDTTMCVDCGVCLKKCPINNLQKNEINLSTKVFKFRLKNKDSLLKSTSGGAFQAIVTSLFNEKCVIYGASWNGLKVVHKRISSLVELNELLSSKYIQSSIGKNIFKSIMNDIDSGLFVIFSGTPCQNAAINSLLDEERRKHVILIEILCHGVPNQWGFDRCIEHEEKIINGKIKSFSFRYKLDTKTDNRKFKFEFERRHSRYDVIGDCHFFPFYKYFHTYSIFRDSCYKCHFRENRLSDIVIGDFWEADKLINEKNPWSISFIAPLTYKGEQIAKKIGEQTDISIFEISKVNESFLRNLPPKKNYLDFYKRITDFSFYKQIREHPQRTKISCFVKNCVKRIINLFLPDGKRKKFIKTMYVKRKL